MTKMYSRYEHPVQYDDAAATAAVGYCKHEPILVLAGCHSTNTHTHKLSKEETKQSIHVSPISKYPETASFHAVTYVMTKTNSYSEHPVQYCCCGVLRTRTCPCYSLGVHSTHTHTLSKEETNRTTQKEAKKQ